MFWSSAIAERNTLSSSDLLVFTSADILVYVGRICHFFLRRCGWKTTSSPDHCFNVPFPACVIFADPVSQGASAVAATKGFLFGFGMFNSFDPCLCGRPHLLWLRRCGCQSSKLSKPLVFSLPIQVPTLRRVVCFTVLPLPMKEAPALPMRSRFASDSNFTRCGSIYPPRLHRCGSSFTLVPTNSLLRFR